MVVVVVLVYLSIYLSIHPSIYLSICLSACLPVCLSTWKPENAAILRDFPNFWTWQRQKPCRTLSLQAIDASIRWWHGRPAPRAPLVRTYTSLSNSSSANGILMSWLIKSHAILRHSRLSSSNTPSVLDQLCNHKQGCKNWSQYKKAALNPDVPHWVLSRSLLAGLLSPELAIIAEGSFLNKVSLPRRITSPLSILVFAHGPSEMGCRPCPPISFPNWPRHCGNNALNRPPATSQNRLSSAFRIPNSSG